MPNTLVQLNPGATEADIQTALNSLPSGGTLVLPANAIIQITKGISIDGSRDITVDLNGSTLQQAGDVYTLSINGRMTGNASATIAHDAAGEVTVTYAGAAKAAVGGYVKIFSDDKLPEDQGAVTRLGQAMKIVAVNGDTLTLEGNLVNADLYKTNVRAAQYVVGDVEVKNGTVRGDQSHSDWQDPLVSARSTVGTHFENVTVRDGNSMGFSFVSTVNGLVTQSAAINLTDDTAHGHYGYGVHSASAVNTTVDGLYVEKVRHGVDDNAVGLNTSDVNSSKYGADIGITATNVVAYQTTSFAFSWHSEGRQGNYSDSVVINSFGVLGARGTDNSLSDVSGSGNSRGILFFEYGDGDGKRITVDGVNLKETAGHSVYTQNAPTNNVLSNSTIEVATTADGTQKVGDANLAMTNTVFKVGAFAIDETISGTSSGDRLLGGSGIDNINAGAGNDYIWGGAGADVLTGGAGSDRFAYLALSEGGDTILDFKGGAKGDIIDLSAIAKSLSWKGDVFDGGYVRYLQSGSNTLVQVDSNGGGNSFTTLVTLKDVAANNLSHANVSTELLVSDYTNHEASSLDTGPVVSIPVAGQVVVPVDSTPSSLPTATSSENANTTPVLANSGSDTHAASNAGSSAVTSAPPSSGSIDAGLKVADASAFSALIGFHKVIGTSGAEDLTGNSHDDLMVGGAGSDTLTGNGGDDVLAGGDGADAMFGGAGVDTASYADAPAAVIASLMKPASNTGFAAGDKYSQIENLTGSKYADTLTGNDGVNNLDGGAGNDHLYGMGGTDHLAGGSGNDWLDGGLRNDTLDGGTGNDRLIGGDGFDTLTGGTGKDVFVLDARFHDSFDTITDFTVGIDKVGLAGTGLSSLSGVAFEVSKSLIATTNAPTLLYNSMTGALLYDADGKGAGDAIKLGVLDHMPGLHISDFVLI